MNLQHACFEATGLHWHLTRYECAIAKVEDIHFFVYAEPAFILFSAHSHGKAVYEGRQHTDPLTPSDPGFVAWIRIFWREGVKVAMGRE
jgi:hypothetical protein